MYEASEEGLSCTFQTSGFSLEENCLLHVLISGVLNCVFWIRCETEFLEKVNELFWPDPAI